MRHRLGAVVLVLVVVACGGDEATTAVPGTAGAVAPAVVPVEETTTTAPTTTAEPAPADAPAGLTTIPLTGPDWPVTGTFADLGIDLLGAELSNLDPTSVALDQPPVVTGELGAFVDVRITNPTDVSILLADANFRLGSGGETLAAQTISGSLLVAPRNAEEVRLWFGPLDPEVAPGSLDLIVDAPGVIPLVLGFDREVAPAGYPVPVELAGRHVVAWGPGCAVELEVLGAAVDVDGGFVTGSWFVEQHRPALGQRFLRIEYRLVNPLEGGCRPAINHFESDVRLLSDGIPAAPVNFINELLSSADSYEGVAVLPFPTGAGRVELVVGPVDGQRVTLAVPVPVLPPVPGE
jgi:hypothetical protein